MTRASRSKYDGYWLSRINEIHQYMVEAYSGKRVIIDIKGINSYGTRQPNSWIGKTIICPEGIVVSSPMAHVKSLERILLEKIDFDKYNVCFSFKITRDLMLIIEKIDKQLIIYKKRQASLKTMNVTNKNSSKNRSNSIIFRNEPLGETCSCDNIFNGFSWFQLEALYYRHLPDKPGVYLIRIIERGDDITSIRDVFRKFIFASEWKELTSYVDSRLRRLSRINKCPLLYIGSTDNVRSRFRELAGQRHTAFFSVLALLLGGWKLDYGFKTVGTREEARRLEERLKQEYVKIHGKLPALVDR